MSKLVTVLGATGAQGGSVVDYLLKEGGGWKVRAVTRKPESDAGKELAKKGVEVVGGDVNKLDDLKKVFAGSYAVFAVTNFYETGKDGEIKQGKYIVDAAKSEGVQHLVFSTLANSEKISNGKRKVEHFTGKAQIGDYMFASGVPSTAVQPACYYENWNTFFTPKPNEKGELQFTTNLNDDTKFALVSIADLGGVVVEVLKNKEKYVGKSVPITGDVLTPAEIAQKIGKAWGKEVKHNHVPEEVFASFPFPAAPELADMFGFFNEYGYYGEKVNNTDIWEGKKIFPGVSTFDKFLADGKGPKSS